MADAQQPLSDLRRTLETTLGDSYSFDRELGGAGMSRVFVAQDRALQRQVVVKVLKPEMSAGVSVDRFRREIQLAAKLQHPHIVPLLASGEIAGTPYFTMPFIEGESLRVRLAREGELPVTETVRIMRHVSAALSYAHRHNVVHRDIKPDNVMLSDEFALVTDFGVAKALSASAGNEDAQDITASGLTGLGLAIGTPAYMAPEQAVADPNVDHRADIYSLGIMAYEMLTGFPPFAKMSAQATLAAQAVEKPIPIQTKRPGLPPALSTLVMRCLEKRPDDRPQTAADVSQELDALTSGAIITHATMPSAPSAAVSPVSARRFPRAAVAGIAALVLAAIGYGIYQSTRSAPAAAASEGEVSSVAVLPLVNVGGDTANDYFSDGMTDELANALGKLPGLRVASRTSTYAFKGKNANVGDIGKALHVQAVLEGTVRRAGDKLRVSAQLTNVADGFALWSDTYERDSKDVFQVQDDIAKSISEALKLRLGARAAVVSSSSHGTNSVEAYDLYLRGIYFFNARGAVGLQRSISYYEQAVAKDPNFGRAYAAMAISYALLPEYTDSPPSDVRQRTQNAANRALAIDSTLAEAHTALGLAALHAWDYETARREYQIAIQLGPRYPTAHQWYGEFLYHVGQVDSAIATIRHAQELDPLAPIITGALGFALQIAGRYSECVTEVKKGLEIAPQLGLLHSMMAFCESYRGNFTTAIASAEMMVRLDKGYSVRKGQLALIYGLAGQKDKAEALANELKATAETMPLQWFPVAMAELGLGNKEAALSALERAVDGHEIGLIEFSLLNERMWDIVRPDPRFARILQRMNLSRYPARKVPG